ncbi:hypothetical protein LIER_12942 [Lithospermum erythrorhizon]|uniref:Uncharacterized protein n=1 Tax=Lithospermum erythrorhizon TaxID=34254 RepID=A0AAV3PW38_LITER
MVDSSSNISSKPSRPSQVLNETLREVRVARRVAEVGSVYSFDDRVHFSLLSSPHIYYSNRQLHMITQGSVNIEAHASIQTPALESLHNRSVMKEAPEDFLGSLLRDSSEAPPSTTSPDLDDSQDPLDVMPLRF